MENFGEVFENGIFFVCYIVFLILIRKVVLYIEVGVILCFVFDGVGKNLVDFVWVWFGCFKFGGRVKECIIKMVCMWLDFVCYKIV